jgi:predicted nuclease with TOPRIM domain
VSGAIVWALLTGTISGGVWVGIVLLRRIRQISERQPAQLEDMQRRLDELEHVDQRLAEVEARLEFAERLLSRQRDAERLPPAGD